MGFEQTGDCQYYRAAAGGDGQGALSGQIPLALTEVEHTAEVLQARLHAWLKLVVLADDDRGENWLVALADLRKVRQPADRQRRRHALWLLVALGSSPIYAHAETSGVRRVLRRL